jgi:hypothetical protein
MVFGYSTVLMERNIFELYTVRVYGLKQNFLQILYKEKNYSLLSLF